MLKFTLNSVFEKQRCNRRYRWRLEFGPPSPNLNRETTKHQLYSPLTQRNALEDNDPNTDYITVSRHQKAQDSPSWKYNSPLSLLCFTPVDPYQHQAQHKALVILPYSQNAHVILY